MDRYDQDPNRPLIAQGTEGLIPFKGTVKEVLTQYVGGLRVGMGQIGAKDILTLRERADFDLVTNAGNTESHPHEVTTTKEPPNYRFRGQK